MADTIFGVFSTREEAEAAITELEDEGYNPKDISIVMKDSADAQVIHESTGASVAEGAVSGATTGAVLGGLAGLLAGTVLPGLGGFLIGGPIGAALGLTGAAATTVSGAATGAVAGGLLGALTGVGVPEEDARVYEDRVNAGAILVAVPVRPGSTRDARAILEDNGADQVRAVSLHSTVAVNA